MEQHVSLQKACYYVNKKYSITLGPSHSNNSDINTQPALGFAKVLVTLQRYVSMPCSVLPLSSFKTFHCISVT